MIRSRSLINKFSFADIFNDINHGYRTDVLKKNSFWLLPFYVTVLLIAIVKRCEERCAMQLYRTSINVNLLRIAWPKMYVILIKSLYPWKFYFFIFLLWIILKLFWTLLRDWSDLITNKILLSVSVSLQSCCSIRVHFSSTLKRNLGLYNHSQVFEINSSFHVKLQNTGKF